ncbi:MAG: ABC transporter ATP-binding protein [Bacteroidales bacterium]|nr:ABC transporter ATP-binding protein [Bacteroidales bacterium]MBQ9702308.1 ABC transporter ATP-binding protein [Bacteroidales bacterium]
MKDFLKLMRQYASPYKGHLAGAVVLNILSAVFNIFSFAVLVPLLDILFKVDKTVYEFIPWDTKMDFQEKLFNNLYYYVSAFTAVHGASFTLFMLAGVMIVFTAFKTSCYFGSNAIMIPISTGIVKEIRCRIYNKILSLPIGFFTEERKGDIIARITGDVSEVENSIIASLSMLIKDPILIVIYFAFLTWLSPEMMLFTIVFAPAFVWVMGLIGKKLKRSSLEAQALWSDTMNQVDETLGGLRVIKAFNAEKTMRQRFQDVTDRMWRKVARVSIRQATAHPVSEFLGTVMIMVVLCVGGVMIIGGKSFLGGGKFIDAPTFIYFLVMLYAVIEPIKELSRATYGVRKGLASMERINKVLEADNPIKDPQNPLPLTGFEKSIRLEHVSFSYEDGKPILKDIDLEIPRGKMIAIVGESGAGKSTLVDLIPRFWDVTEGRITLDGKDIREVSLKDLRSLMGNVNQEPILFNDTIFNNIAFGVEGASQADVEAAAKVANAHEFILEKEEGYQTNIGDRGSKLSGGQRQRLSIARAILKNPPILILDEATASLDTESERAVQDALDHLMSTRTTIAIAHRLSTIRHADEIIVLHEGRIVERGKHEELIALGGYYKKLNDMQAL